MDQLFHAIRQGDLAKIKALLQQHPAYLNGQDARGFTPLIMATYTGNSDIARYLLAQGAAVNGRDAAGNTALMGVCFKGDQEMAELLISQGADVKLQNKQGNTAMQYAIEQKNASLQKILEAHI